MIFLDPLSNSILFCSQRTRFSWPAMWPVRPELIIHHLNVAYVWDISLKLSICANEPYGIAFSRESLLWHHVRGLRRKRFNTPNEVDLPRISNMVTSPPILADAPTELTKDIKHDHQGPNIPIIQSNQCNKTKSSLFLYVHKYTLHLHIKHAIGSHKLLNKPRVLPKSEMIPMVNDNKFHFFNYFTYATGKDVELMPINM